MKAMMDQFSKNPAFDMQNLTEQLDKLMSEMDPEELERLSSSPFMAFNFDDHVKNTSFLMNQKGEWSLAPAYDLTFAYDKDGRFTNSHQILINGKAFNVTYEDYIECGKRMGLSKLKMNQIIQQVREAVFDFEKYADGCGISEERMEYIKKIILSKK